MRFVVWRFVEGDRLPQVVERTTTAREAEEVAERTYAKQGGVRVVAVDGEAGEILLSLPPTAEN